MTLDGLIQVGQVAITCGAAGGMFRGGLAIRDAVRGLTLFTAQLRKEMDDHEERLRFLEGGERIDRRSHERRRT